MVYSDDDDDVLANDTMVEQSMELAFYFATQEEESKVKLKPYKGRIAIRSLDVINRIKNGEFDGVRK